MREGFLFRGEGPGRGGGLKISAAIIGGGLVRLFGLSVVGRRWTKSQRDREVVCWLVGRCDTRGLFGGGRGE